jgi:capsular polysaccharide biosynthesis protein
VAPTAPIKPRKAWDLAIAVVAGLILGLGAALLAERLDTSVRTPDDVERLFGLPVIGIIPAFSGKR